MSARTYPTASQPPFTLHKLARHRCYSSEYNWCGVESRDRADLNTILFLIYLFCSIFVLLSMFLAMLGEAQANLRDDQLNARKEAAKKGEQLPPEYGILHEGQRAIMKSLMRVPVLKKLVKDPDALLEMNEKGTLMSVFEEQMEQIDRLDEHREEHGEQDEDRAEEVDQEEDRVEVCPVTRFDPTPVILR